MRAPDEMLSLAQEGVKLARSLGADDAEVYVSSSEGVAINATGPYVIPTRSQEQGVAVRVSVKGRLGQSGSHGSARVLQSVVKNALDAALRAPDATRFSGFARPTEIRAAPTSIHPALAGNDLDRVSTLAESAAATLSAPRDVSYHGVRLESLSHRFVVANSNGVEAWDQHGHERLQLEARVTRGTTERSTQDVAYASTPIETTLDVAQFAADGVARARSALDPQPLSGVVTEAILLPAPAAIVFSLFTPALSGRRAAAKQTPLAGKLGEIVASPLLTLRDNPSGPGGVRHQRVDHEGTPTRDATLVSEGRLLSFLLDHEASARLDAPSTGHGLRAGVLGGVNVHAINIDVAPGAKSLDEIIAGTERAVLVNEPLMGGYVANDTTGDFSLVAPFAFLVENGKIAHALPPLTVGGNAHRALRELRDVSAQRRANLSGTYPGIRIGGVSCAS